jgi:hypothetical protein
MNRFRFLFSLLALLPLIVTAHAQTAPAPEITHVSLRPSSVPLLIHGNSTWAIRRSTQLQLAPLGRNGLNDSQW